MYSFSLKQSEYKIPNSPIVEIDPDLINVLRQTRTEMSNIGIHSLASSIMKHGQQNPGIVFAFLENEAEIYIKNLNKLWHTDYQLSEFEKIYIYEFQKEYYLFLVAGHRRLEAVKLYDDLKYIAQIFFEKSFEEAIVLQYEENFHEDVPLYDIINFVSYYWVSSKERYPKITLKTFSKNIHKTPNWVSNVLKFSGLPLNIQKLINESEISKGVNYTTLLEFAKLYEFSKIKKKELSEELLFSLINHCITHKYNFKKVKEFCEIQKEEILGQTSIFELSPEEINNNSLTFVRRERTLFMSTAEEYLTTVGPIVKTITENCKNKSVKVLEKGKELGKILSGDDSS